MARDYSHHQQKIIRNYYEHRDTIRTQKLSELVTEIYLAGNSAKATKLWEKVRKELSAAGVPADRITHVVDAKRIDLLPGVVQDIDSGKITKRT